MSHNLIPNGKHLIFVVISFLIVVLVTSPSATYDIFVDALENHPDENPFCMTSKRIKNGVEYQLERCCYRDPPNTGVGQGVPIVETCEVCEFREGHQDEFQICEEEGPTVLRPGTKLGDTGPLTGGGVLDPGSPLPTDQNVVPGGGVVEPDTGTKVPSSKGTKSPLDTILGFNEPPATSESDDSGLPPPDETSERINNPQTSPTGYCVRDIVTTCIPCDPGLPGGDARCTPNNEWPPIMSPLPGQSGVDEAPLLADEEEPEEGCLDTSAPSTCLPCKIGEPGCVTKDKLPQPIPLNEAQKGNELTQEEADEGTTTQDTNKAPLATESQSESVVDSDNDSVTDEQDNCPNVANEDQLDSNDNGVGDVCDQVEEQPTADTSENQGQGQPEQGDEGNASSNDSGDEENTSAAE